MSTNGQAVLGIDTHKHTHVAVVLDGLGRALGMLQFPASDAGAAQLLEWTRAHGSPMTAGVEGTGSYGYQLTRSLQAAGMTVAEVNRPDRANRRRKGKSDPVDAKPPGEPSWPVRPGRSPRTGRERWKRCGR